MNWDDARIFLAVEREGTLRGASKQLGIDQATVGRRLAGMERDLGAILFLRGSDGLTLTHAGETLLEAAERMELGAHDIERQVLGSDDRAEGIVRIATTDSLALEFVIPAIGRLREAYPGIAIDLSASTEIRNLVRREADVAIRTVPPENPDLLARRLARWPMGLYAARAYLDRNGAPSPGGGFEGHDLVVYQPHVAHEETVTLAGEPIGSSRTVATASSSLMVRAMIRAGLGLGEVAVPLADVDQLVRVWPDRFRAQPYDIWLVAHRDLRRTARIRAVIDEIVATFDAGQRGRPDRARGG